LGAKIDRFPPISALRFRRWEATAERGFSYSAEAGATPARSIDRIDNALGEENSVTSEKHKK